MAFTPHLKHYITDGTKAVPISALPEEAWNIVTGNNGKVADVEKYYSAVAFLYRCVDVRANSFASVPWTLYRGDTEVWTSEEDEPPADVEWASDLPELFWLTEAALCLVGTAYWSHDTNRLRTKHELGWYAPQTMTPKWDKMRGLTGFERQLGGTKIPLSPEDVVYFYLLNGLHETEPRAAPAEAAMRAAGVIYNVDLFAESFFKRGAIKATLLTVTGNPPEAERRKLKAWWKRFFSGVEKAFEAEVVNAEAVQPVVVGEGIKELSDVQLTTEKREDIATAMGIPHSLVLSNAATYATSQQDETNFYTQTIIPQTKIVGRQLNRQLFAPLGYRLQFMPDAMSLFQEDEEQRSVSVQHLVQSGLDVDVAMEILGYDLTDELWARVRAKVQQADEQRQQITEQLQQPAQIVTSDRPQLPPPQADEEKAAEIARFKRWAKNPKRREDPDPAEFDSDILSHAEKATILGDATDEGSLKQLSSEERQYRQELNQLILQANRNEIERQEFIDRVVEITTTFLILAFLDGARFGFGQLQERPELQQVLIDNERIARESAERLAVDVYENRLYDRRPGTETTPAERRRSRIDVWVGTALGLYALGQTFRPDDPFLMWTVGPTEHCADCLRLDGQVHRAAEWQASGWHPQSRGLECNGYRCACSLVEADGPSRGGF